MLTILRSGLLATAFVILAGCAAQRPVVYATGAPAGDDPRIQAAIDDCIALANANGAGSDQGERVAANTATNAAVGGGTGAVVGAISGGHAGRGAAIGALGAGVATLLRGAFASGEPGAIHKRYVEQCLREQGLKPIGWG